MCVCAAGGAELGETTSPEVLFRGFIEEKKKTKIKKRGGEIELCLQLYPRGGRPWTSVPSAGCCG